MVEAHLPAAPVNGQQKQGGDRSQPKGKIQNKGRPPPLQAPADGPHPIVDQAQQAAHQDPPEHERPLGQYIRRHGQRSSRAKNPPRPAD